MQKKAVFISAPIYEAGAFGANHPLSYTRHSSVLQLCNYMDWLAPDEPLISEMASKEILSRFHDPDYINAFQKASVAGRASVADRETYNIGTMENPIFKGVFERASMTVGGSILSAQRALAGEIAYHPAGGTHHGKPDKASGFCYFNDPVYAILTFLDAGLSNILYLDLDAHFGDGVAAAFEGENRVSCISIHEENRWPYSGTLQDSVKDNINIAVPPNLNDREFKVILDRFLREKIEQLAPSAIVIVAGADCLYGDPLSKMNLRNETLWRFIQELSQSVPHAVVLGGGGYNPWVTVRYWAGLWAKLSGQIIPDVLPLRATNLLSGFDSDLVDEEDRPPEWLEKISDKPSDAPCREEIYRFIESAKRHFAELK